MTVIYALVDPTSGEVRYIGKTKNIKQRLQQHISKARHHLDHHCARWIRTLLDQGMTPQIVVVSEVPPRMKWQDAEASAISFYRMAGHDLTNLTAGGDGFHDMDPECIRRSVETRKRTMSDPVRRAEVSRASREAHARPEVKEKMRAALKASWADPETRERYLAGARHPETVAKRSVASKRRMADPVTLAQHTQLMKELAQDPVRRSEILAAQAERWNKPDSKDKHRKRLAQFYSDPANRALIGEASRKTWQSPKRKALHVAQLKQRHVDDPSYQDRIQAGLRNHWDNPESRADHVAKFKAFANQPEEKERRSERLKARFNDPAYVVANRERLRLGREKRWADYRAKKAASKDA